MVVLLHLLYKTKTVADKFNTPSFEKVILTLEAVNFRLNINGRLKKGNSSRMNDDKVGLNF